MTEITVTKDISVFSREDIKEVIQYIGSEGYFANSYDEFKYTCTLSTLDMIQVRDIYDEDVFHCDDGSYSLFAKIKE